MTAVSAKGGVKCGPGPLKNSCCQMYRLYDSFPTKRSDGSSRNLPIGAPGAITMEPTKIVGNRCVRSVVWVSLKLPGASSISAAETLIIVDTVGLKGRIRGGYK